MSVNLSSTSQETLHYAGYTDDLLRVEENGSKLPIAQNHFLLRHILQTVNAQSCPGSYNFHMHTVKSDGKLQPSEIIEQALAIGLSGLAITDHHTTKGYHEAQKCLDSWKASQSENNTKAPILWTGIEINAKLLNTEVHILGYAFDPTASCLKPYLRHQVVTGSDYQAQNVIAAIQKAGGLAVLAHPARYRRAAHQLIPEAARLGIDGVEVYYNYRATDPWLPTPETTEEVETLSQTYGLIKTCGTDTHGTNLLLRR
ncbi:MAG: PHP domain-containing protein [Microcoleaceae cyanobacterium]